MRILAFDLATHTGWAQFDSATRLLESGTAHFDRDKGLPRGHTFYKAQEYFMLKIGTFQPNRIVVEAPFKRGAYADRIGFGLPAIVEMVAAKWRDIEVSEVAATTVKLWATGHGHATKEMMALALPEKMHELMCANWNPSELDDDEIDALLILCWALEQGE